MHSTHLPLSTSLSYEPIFPQAKIVYSKASGSGANQGVRYTGKVVLALLRYVDLQQLVNALYDQVGYDYFIDYSSNLPPPCLGALGVAIAIGILTSRSITRPILQLNQASFAIASGQLDQNVEVKGINELEKLANSFNSMAGQLQQSFEKLEQQNEELKRLDKLKNEFLANTSHELRTPLNGIIGIAESLIDGATGELTQTTQTNLQLIISSGRRLANLVNDILDFSKLRHKNLELQLKPVDIRAITNLVLILSQPSAKSQNLQLINAIPTDLPPAEADENRLQQILYNLVGNAIKFTPSGTVEVSAKVVNGHQSLVISPKRLSNDKGQIAITISDTGIGIPSDKFDSIFESFEQAEGSTARVYGGTGLGLAVTKQLVELHGGEISVNSKVGEGSQFTFILPISQSQVASTPEIPVISDNINLELIASKNLQSQIAHGKEFKVLIVDDEPVNRQVLVNNLSLYDYTLSEASNGQEALEIIENGFIPDIILLDIMMPQMTGYEVCKQIRLRYRAHELPIVMLTAKNQVEAKRSHSLQRISAAARLSSHFYRDWFAHRKFNTGNHWGIGTYGNNRDCRCGEFSLAFGRINQVLWRGYFSQRTYSI